ncbi:hypothetical protein, partial [Acetomicrobium sp. S15 = DSM 107314]|uniref:hypothetical protein n=1 Tax=Acetomicrobium sp. S15 = DSM 107314 TaxID=2529858 RepID=UPI00406CCBB0
MARSIHPESRQAVRSYVTFRDMEVEEFGYVNGHANIEGRFIRAAAISMAAGDLSQEAKNTAPSKRSMWPPIIVSISAAMS